MGLPGELFHLDIIQTELELNGKIDGIQFKSIIDAVTTDKKIVEYKTGKTPWTQERADNHGQIYFEYLIMDALGLLPSRKAKLIWFETGEIDGEIYHTGNITEFDVVITDEQLEFWKKELVQVHQAIKEAYEAYTLGTEDYRVAELSDLKKQKDEIEAKYKALSAEIFNDLEAGKNINSSFGLVYLSEKKTKTTEQTKEMEELILHLEKQKKELDEEVQQYIKETDKLRQLQEDISLGESKLKALEEKNTKISVSKVFNFRQKK